MARRHILVVNCGSSSIKFALTDCETERHTIKGGAERLGAEAASLDWAVDGAEHSRALGAVDHTAAFRAIGEALGGAGLERSVVAVGHRVVHGGEDFSASVLIDDQVLAAIERCTHLAPLHNPANILGIHTARTAFPKLPHVAVFDTAFHQTLEKRAYLYAVPYRLYADHGVRRYGFHGTSHRFVTQRAAALLGQPVEECAFVSAHLGNGCSASAVRGGKSVDTTMGLTPLEGLVMGTRSGDIDPGLHAYLCEALGCSLADVMNILNKESGLLGLSALSNDMRELIDAAAGGNEQASLAIELFCYRLAKAVGALFVSLGTVGTLIFTGGIGEHAAAVRARVLRHLAFLGFVLDPERNAADGRESGGRITGDDGRHAMVVPTDEELMIARDTRALIG
jgi:acetate kinase